MGGMRESARLRHPGHSRHHAHVHHTDRHWARGRWGAHDARHTTRNAIGAQLRTASHLAGAHPVMVHHDSMRIGVLQRRGGTMIAQQEH